MFDNIMHDLTVVSAKHLGTPIIMMGDFNARTGEVGDLVEIGEMVTGATGIDMELFDDHSDKKAELLGIDLNRHNQDKLLNSHGHELLKILKTTDMKIINGRFGDDAGIGSFTCSNAKGRSTIDYAITSTSLLPNVAGFKVDVLDKCISDVHSAIQLKIRFHNTSGERAASENLTANENQSKPTITMKWETNKAKDYANAINRITSNLIIAKRINLRSESYIFRHWASSVRQIGTSI